MFFNSHTKIFEKVKNNAKKKTTCYYEQDPQKVREYFEKIKDVPKEKIVYIDETGIDKCLSRKYGRSPKGERVYGKVYGHKFERTNIVAAQQNNQILAPLQYKGMMNSQFFETWFEQHLVPLLKRGTVVVMDNASFHRKKQLENIANKHGIKIIFLPPYSPELNPIEHFWNWLKKKITDSVPYFQKFDDVIYSIFKVL